MSRTDFVLLLALAFVAGLLIVWGGGSILAMADEEQLLYACPEHGTVNLRATPGGRVIGQLSRGDSGELTLERDGWIYLSILGQEEGGGWVKSEYLTEDLSLSGDYRNASGGRVRIRRSPAGKTFKWLAKGEAVHVTAVRARDGSLWGYIGNGWVSMDCMVRE